MRTSEPGCLDRRGLVRLSAGGLAALAGACAAPGVPDLPPASARIDRATALVRWRARIAGILARGGLPIIDTEATYNSGIDADRMVAWMDELDVAQLCFAPFAGLGSAASLGLHLRHPAHFVPTTTDGSSPHWYRDTGGFAAATRADLATGNYFLMGELELRHYPSPNQYRADATRQRDVTVPLDDPGLQAMFLLAEQTGIAVQLHLAVEDALIPPFERLLARHPRARVIWCHLGQVRVCARAPGYVPALVARLLERHPGLHLDLGLPGPGHVHPMFGERDQEIYDWTREPPWGGRLKPEWQALIEHHAGRVLAASDLGPDRWRNFPDIIRRLRALVLDRLSPAAAHAVAYRNAWRLIAGADWTDPPAV